MFEERISPDQAKLLREALLQEDLISGEQDLAQVVGEVVGHYSKKQTKAATLEGRTADALLAVGAIAESGADLQGSLDDMVAEGRSALLAKILPDGGEDWGFPVLGDL